MRFQHTSAFGRGKHLRQEQFRHGVVASIVGKPLIMMRQVAVVVLSVQAANVMTSFRAGDSGDNQAFVAGGVTVVPSPDPYAVVGVCPIPQGSRTWAIAWHFSPEDIDPVSAVRVQKYLEGSDFDDCLVTVITTDKDTSALVGKVTPESTDEEFAAMTGAVRRRWSALGADRAIVEVMKEGKRGKQVGEFLNACAQLRENERGKR